MSDWTKVTADAGLAVAAEALRKEELGKAVEQYLSLSARIEELTHQLDDIKAQLLAEFDEAAEEQERTFGQYSVTVKRSERWTWDSEQVEKMVADGPLPEFVKKAFSVDKRKFMKQDPVVRDAYLHALTRKPGPASISVTATSATKEHE